MPRNVGHVPPTAYENDSSVVSLFVQWMTAVEVAVSGTMDPVAVFLAFEEDPVQPTTS
jgi:hypothetical protein